MKLFQAELYITPDKKLVPYGNYTNLKKVEFLLSAMLLGRNGGKIKKGGDAKIDDRKSIKSDNLLWVG